MHVLIDIGIVVVVSFLVLWAMGINAYAVTTEDYVGKDIWYARILAFVLCCIAFFLLLSIGIKL